jgi:hypothetical protein
VGVQGLRTAVATVMWSEAPTCTQLLMEIRPQRSPLLRHLQHFLAGWGLPSNWMDQRELVLSDQSAAELTSSALAECLFATKKLFS